MKRYLYPFIKKDLAKKMVFVTGPRQVGKTYLAKALMSEFKNPIYLNYDDISDAKVIKKRTWPQSSDLIIFDEIHKMKGWKMFLKGTFDTRLETQRILVTGSARLETFRQGGESLAGRYFHYRLNPLSVKEVNDKPAHETLDGLNILGGFPEPFLSDSTEEAGRWRNQYYSDLVREDILEFSKIQEIRAIKILLELLRKRVGSPISYLSLAGDLQVSPNTVRKYIAILESLYIIFLVRPFHKNIARSILKEPKVYFYDSGFVDGEEGIRLENTIAAALLKHAQFLQDTQGKNIALNYLRLKDGREIDFVIAQDGDIAQAVEVKLSEENISRHFKYFKEKLPEVLFVQLVHNLRRERDEEQIQVRAAGPWLKQLAA